MRRSLLRLAALVTVTTGACAPARTPLPTGPGEPWSDFADAFDQATSRCRTLRSLSAELAIAGRAGHVRLRGRVHAGFLRPDAMRLEAVAPLGPPLFVLVARGEEATLLLPRERRVLTSAPGAILAALVGLALDASDLMALVAGCAVAEPVAESARLFGRGGAAVALRDGSVLYLERRDDHLRVRAARRGRLVIEYGRWRSGVPVELRLRRSASPAEPVVDLTVRISQVAIDPALGADVFAVTVPPGTMPLTLDELRQLGPWAGARDSS